MTPTCVIADGPYVDYDPEDGEFPFWCVFLADDDGCDVGQVHRFFDPDDAFEFGRRLAKKHRVEFVNELGPA